MKSAAATLKPTLTPRLRFPEFRDGPGWEESELRTLADPVSERAANDHENNILTLSGEQGLVLQSEYFGKQIAGTNAERYLRIQRDDFVYNDRVTKASAYGTIKRLKNHPHGIVSPIYKCFRFKEGELPGFWECYFEAGAHESQLRSLANEGARAGRFNVSIDRFLATSVWAPDSTSAEQRKIASCLSSLDDLIAAERQQLDALKAHKQGLMQQLFPREGETRPRLRFPEFQNAPEWEIQALGKLASISTERVGARQCIPMSITAGVGLVSQQEKFGRIIAGGQYKNYLLLRKGDFAYNKSATKEFPQGYIALYSGEELAAVPNSIFTCFRIHGDSTVRQYLNYLFMGNLHGRWLRKFITIGARAHGSLNIDGDDILSVPVPLPAWENSLAEQDRIASCLSSLDDLIAAQSDKLESLKTHKKGLMQQLFPSPEEHL